MDIQQMIRNIWPDWEIVEKIGFDSYGTVYRVRRRDLAGVVDAAIKATRAPRDDSKKRPCAWRA